MDRTDFSNSLLDLYVPQFRATFIILSPNAFLNQRIILQHFLSYYYALDIVYAQPLKEYLVL